jgi:hypothetical protein
MSVPHTVTPQAVGSDGVMLSVVAMVLEQPAASGVAREMVLLTGPLWAAALLSLPARPLERFR